MLLRQISIGKRATGAFALMTFVLLALGLFCLSQMQKLNQAATDIEQHWLSGVLTLTELNHQIGTVRLEGQRFRASRDEAVRSRSKQLIQQGQQRIEQLQSQYQQRALAAQEQQLLSALGRSLVLYFDDLNQLLQAAEQGQLTDQLAESLNAQLSSSGSAISRQMQDLIEFNREGAAQAAHSNQSLFQQANQWVWLVLAFSVLLMVTLAVLLTRSIRQPLLQAVKAAQQIASGHLHGELDVRGKDEAAELLQAMDQMRLNLRGIIENIRDAAQQLASATEEMNMVISSSTADLQQQSSEIELTASAMSQMTAAVGDVAGNAVSTSALSQLSDEQARLGNQRVSQSIHLIEELVGNVVQVSAKAEQLALDTRSISAVLEVIQTLAEQTNLLALNAAIEAARAGDSGRGFAVVADEVRSLAQRTQQSAHEIAHTISRVQQQTTDTVQSLQLSAGQAELTLEQARAADQALAQITGAISQISARNLAIAGAAGQQAIVAREVDQSLLKIRDLSTQTAAGASQTSQASHELSRLAVNLTSLVERFAC